MAQPQPNPSASHVIPLDSQVGGHPGVMTTEDGSLIIKTALPVELKFYQTVLNDPAFVPLRDFVPKFIGTLKLEGEATAGGDGTVIKPVEGQDKEQIVIENLQHPFLKPNILDIKLGTVLYDEYASQEKKERMTKTAQETTSWESGVRLTGFQVHNNNTGQPVNTPKSYGKSIKVSDLPDGISRFFPIGDLPSSTSGLPRDTLVKVLNLIIEDVQEIRDIISKLEIRMAGGSLLIIYEADWARAEEALKRLEDEDEEDEEDEEDDDEENKVGPPFVAKIIDFAHTYHVPGRGPDEGVLKGIDTTLALLKGRVEQILKE